MPVCYTENVEHLTDKQLEKISDVLVAIGEVLFASFVARSFFGIETNNLFMLSLGLILSLLCFGLSITLVRRVKEV